ncbi:MAG: hypothetical protein IGQ45_02310, partial [Cyanobacterium sp. T60_A2020_053]|nr:hypothetical protein [Cyanobacterium sp. T60_A2020_053]
MTNNSDNNPAPSTQRPSSLKLLIYLLLLISAGSLSYGWYFLTQKLVPLIESPVSNFLNRDVDLGDVKAVGFNSIKIGKSSINSDKNNLDYVTTDEVEISVNPLQLLNRKIELTINLIDANGYLEKDLENQWVELNLSRGERKPFYGFNFAVDKITVNQGYLTLENQVKDEELPLLLKIDQGIITFNSNQNKYNFFAQSSTGGKIQFEALQNNQENKWLLDIKGKELLTDEIYYFVDLPIDAEAGKVNGDIQLVFENSLLENYNGNLDVSAVNVNIPNLPQPLTNSNGKIILRNRAVEIEKVNTNLGEINGDVTGIIDDTNQLNLQVNTDSVAVGRALESLNLPPLPFAVTGEIIGNLDIKGSLTQPEIITNISALRPINFLNTDFTESQANFTIINNDLMLENFTLKTKAGGEIKGEGEVSLAKEETDFAVTGEVTGIDLRKFTENLTTSALPLSLKLVRGEYKVTGFWQNFSATQWQGKGEVNLNGGRVIVNDLAYNQNNYQGDLQLIDIPLDTINICETVECADGKLQGDLQLTGDSQNISLSGDINVNGASNFNGARIIVNDFTYNQNNYQGDLQLIDIPLDTINICETVECADGKLQGDLQLTGDSNNISLAGIDLTGNFSFPLADTIINLNNTQLTQGEWQTELNAVNLDLGSLGESIDNFNFPLQTGKFDTNLTVRGNINNFSAVEVNGEGKVNLPEGMLTVERISLDRNNNFSSDISALHLNLDNWGDLGKTSGKVTVTGNLNNFSVDTIDVAGNLTFEKGINVIKQPVNADFVLNDGKIFVKKATSEDISARGVINYDFDEGSIQDWDLFITASGIDVETLPLPNSLQGIDYQGKLNVEGNLTGNLQQPLFKGDVTVNKFSLGDLAFNNLGGNVSVESLDAIRFSLFDVTNKNNRLTGVMGAGFLPQEFNLQVDGAEITGVNRQDTLAINISNFSVTPLTKSLLPFLTDNEYVNYLDGKLSADINVNLANFDFVTNNVVIAKAQINNFISDKLTAQVVKKDDKILIDTGELVKGENKYNFQATILPFGDNPEIEAEMMVSNGDIQTLLTGAGIYNINDIFQDSPSLRLCQAKDLYSTQADCLSGNPSPLAVVFPDTNLSTDNLTNSIGNQNNLLLSFSENISIDKERENLSSSPVVSQDENNLFLVKEGSESLSNNQNISIDKERENLSSLPVTSKADELTENQTNLSLAREGSELLSDNQNISIDKERENLSSLPVTSKADELTENQTNLSLAREGSELLSDNQNISIDKEKENLSSLPVTSKADELTE